jgi:hypothetical protein
LRATLNQAGSTLASPAAVENMTGQTDAMAIRKMIESSHALNTNTAIGIHDSGLIMRRNWNAELLRSRKRLLRPMMMPIGTPIAIAISMPPPSRYMLAAIAFCSLPRFHNSGKACSVGTRPKPEKLWVFGFMAIM